MFCLVVCASLCLSSCIHKSYYIMEYCISLLSKHVVIVINRDSFMFRGQNMGCSQNAIKKTP